MVTLLALLPPALAAILLAVDAALPANLLTALSSSWSVYLGLSVAVLLAILAAAYVRRDSLMLSSAWLFLFCGMMLMSLAELLELLHIAGPPWVSDLFEAAGFFPLLIFAAGIETALILRVQ